MSTRDPNFWKRFSIAAHQQKDMESQQVASNGSGGGKAEKTWLSRQEAKRSRRTFICWAFWLAFLSILAVVLVATIWLARSGMLVPGASKDGADGAGGAAREG